MIENEIDPVLNNKSKELRERFSDLGIKAILFDFDDTLIYTSEIFQRFMKEYVETVSLETGIDFETIDRAMRRINDEEYKTMGVSPARWGTVIERMSKEFIGNESSILSNLDILMSIYNEEPIVRSGTKAVLEEFRRSGVKMGLVTHANVEWTWKKITSAGIIDYFDAILIADENGHKNIKHWESIMRDMEVLPGECLVVGDNLGGDIIPPSKIGARTVWLNKGSSWSIYRTGEVPKSTIVIDSIDELLSAMDSLR